jgi:hypothetical protein
MALFKWNVLRLTENFLQKISESMIKKQRPFQTLEYSVITPSVLLAQARDSFLKLGLTVHECFIQCLFSIHYDTLSCI